MPAENIPFCIRVRKSDLAAVMFCYRTLQNVYQNAIIYLIAEKDVYQDKEITDWFGNTKSTAKKVQILLENQEHDLLAVNLPKELLCYKKVLILNEKSVFMEDISYLFSIDMEQKLFAACRKNLTKWQANEYETKLGIKEKDCLDFHFCLVNIEQYKETNVKELFDTFFKQEKKLALTEEEAANFLFRGQTMILDEKWNRPLKEVDSDRRLNWFTDETKRRMYSCGFPVSYSYQEETVMCLSGLIEQQHRNLSEMREVCDKQENEKNQLRCCLEEQKRETENLKEQLQVLQKQYESCNTQLSEIRESFSYKCGLGFTYLLRKMGMRLHKKECVPLPQEDGGIRNTGQSRMESEGTVEKSEEKVTENLTKSVIRKSFPEQQKILETFCKDVREGNISAEQDRQRLCDVEDELIIDTVGMGNLSFILWLLTLKHGILPEIQAVRSEQDGILCFHGYQVARMSYLAVTLHFIDIQDGKLMIEGTVSVPAIWKTDCSFCTEVIRTSGNDISIKKEVTALQDLNDCEMDLYLGKYPYESKSVFKIEAELVDADIKITFYNQIGGQNYKYGKINVMRFCPVADLLPGQYAAKDGYIVTIEGDAIYCRRSSEQEVKKKEQDFEEELTLIGTEEACKAVALRREYFKQKKKQTKPIWLFMDRVNRADDNAEVLFEYVQKDKNIESYFIIDECSNDYTRLKKIGKVIALNSPEHLKLTVLADYILTSQANGLVENPFQESSEYYRDLYHRPKMIFLQHGVTKDDQHTTFNRYNTNLAGFITSTKAEYQSILDGKYYYTKEEVWLTGMPRFDRLYHNEKKIVLIMPSWRKGLMSQKWDEGTKSMMWKKEDNFEQSEFVKRYQSLLTNLELICACKKYGYQIAFMPHALLEPYIDSFLLENTDCLYWDKTKSYRDAFAEGNLLVTDYSSVAFDFAYLKKPVIYYQFDKESFFGQHTYQKGYFEYENDGFGPVVQEEKELVEQIIRAMEGRCMLQDQYRKRIENTFVYGEISSCEQLYKILLEKTR